MGEGEPRLYALSAWHDAPFDTDRERAALAWAEAVTLVADGHVPDEVYAHARQHFSEQARVHLTMAVVAINGWNRLAISCRWPAGGYQPKRSHLTSPRPVPPTWRLAACRRPIHVRTCILARIRT
jgi:hypothetical protein